MVRMIKKLTNKITIKLNFMFPNNFKLHQKVYLKEKHGVMAANSTGKIVAVYTNAVEVDFIYKNRHITLFLDNWDIESVSDNECY